MIVIRYGDIGIAVKAGAAGFDNIGVVMAAVLHFAYLTIGGGKGAVIGGG